MVKDEAFYKTQSLENKAVLWPAAHHSSHQGAIVAHWILGMYNAYDYPLMVNDLRALDARLRDALLRELEVDSVYCSEEIHGRWGLNDEDMQTIKYVHQIKSVEET